MKVERRQIWWSLWLQWVAVTVGSLALAAEVVRRILPAIFGLHVATVVVTGLAVMSLVGVAQGLILRRFGVPLRVWMLATVAGSVIIITLAALMPLSRASEENIYSYIALLDGARAHGTPIGGLVAVGSMGSGATIERFDTIGGMLMAWLVGGASIGVAQWLVLRRRIVRAGWWIPATILGKVAAGITACGVLGLMIGLVTSLEVPVIVSLAGMGVYSAVQGAVTGVVLVWGTRQTPVSS